MGRPLAANQPTKMNSSQQQPAKPQSKTTGACTRKKFLKWFTAHYKEIQADCRAETRAILADIEQVDAQDKSP